MPTPSPTTSSFYPSVVARFIVRLDEALQANSSIAAPAGASYNWLPPGAPNYYGAFNLVPKNASIEVATPRQCGKFNATFMFRDFPLDPQVVRAMTVEWHVGTISSLGFSKSVVGTTPGQRAAYALSPRTFNMPNYDTMRLFGLVDTIHTEHTGKESVITVEGRDPAGVLLDSKILATDISGIDFKQSIDKVVEQILHSGTLGVLLKDARVYVDPAEWDQGIVPSPAYNINQPILNRVNMGTAGDKPGLQPPGQSGQLSYWDLITQYCTLVGAIPRFDRDLLRIHRARNVLSQIQGPSPFRDGKPRTLRPNSVATQLETNIRYFVYGRDVETTKLERKYQGKVVPRVVVWSTDGSRRGSGKQIQGFWPPKGTTAAELKLGNETINVSYPAIKDPARLTMIARDLYEEMGAGTGEVGGSATTHYLSTLGGDNTDPDVLRLMPTDAIFMGVDTRALSSKSPLNSILTDTQRASESAAAAELTKRLGVDPSLAALIVASGRNQPAATLGFFRVGTVKYQWDSDKGIAVDFDFANYVFPKNAFAEQAPPQPAKVVGKTSRVQNSPPAPKVVPLLLPESPQIPVATVGTSGTFSIGGGGT